MLAAFGSTAAIGISHAAKLAPLLRAPFMRKLVQEASLRVAEEQADRRSSGAALLSASQVLSKLLTSPVAKDVRQAVVTDNRNRTLVSGERLGSGTVTIKLTPTVQRDRETALEAVRQLLDKLS